MLDPFKRELRPLPMIWLRIGPLGTKRRGPDRSPGLRSSSPGAKENQALIAEVPELPGCASADGKTSVNFALVNVEFIIKEYRNHHRTRPFHPPAQRPPRLRLVRSHSQSVL